VTTYLRSDINICGGESGAPVFNGDGSLCGVLIAALPELRSSFIIPETALGRIFNDIINDKSVKYCSAGFSVRGQISEIGQKEVVISSIDEQKIKYNGTETLKIGDIVTKIEGQEIASEGDIANVLFLKHPNESLSISVIRDKEVLEIVITLSEKNL
jgi:S1-C subfamily serine protease